MKSATTRHVWKTPITLAQRAKVPVYVLGSQAVFGRIEGYVDYVDPKTKHVFRGVPGEPRP